MCWMAASEDVAARRAIAHVEAEFPTVLGGEREGPLPPCTVPSTEIPLHSEVHYGSVARFSQRLPLRPQPAVEVKRRQRWWGRWEIDPRSVKYDEDEARGSRVQHARNSSEVTCRYDC